MNLEHVPAGYDDGAPVGEGDTADELEVSHDGDNADAVYFFGGN